MADNVPITAGSGTSIATDDVGGVHYQRVKNTWGPNNTATDVDASATAAMPVMPIGGATNAAAQVTVSNSSTSIAAADTDRRGVLILNLQTVAVYIDPSGGTASTSMFRLDPGASLFLPVTTAVTGITTAAYSASGDAKVHVITVA